MSEISNISNQFKNILEFSQEEFKSHYIDKVISSKEFYDSFFNNLILNFKVKFNNSDFRRQINEKIKKLLGLEDNKLNFIAIDGTCSKEQFSEMMTFYGGAYGAKGEIHLDSENQKIRYKRWSFKQDVSMVAWVPIPLARLDEVVKDKEEFIESEYDKVNTSNIHTQIMQLSEIFLAINTINTSAIEAPNLLLMDLAPSSVLASVSHKIDYIGFTGYEFDNRSLSKADLIIANSFPSNVEFNLPSKDKNHRKESYIINFLATKSRHFEFSLDDISNELSYNKSKLKEILNYLSKNYIVEKNVNKYRLIIDIKESWNYTKRFCNQICTKLFKEKDQKALLYDSEDEFGVIRKRWMSPYDIEFLISVSVKNLIEVCWDRNVLFYGIVKDSASKYLTRNYLGVCKQLNIYEDLNDNDFRKLPWSDRVFCEMLPYVDNNLETPWSTIEFDSAFMTLNRAKDEANSYYYINGVMGYIVNQEKLFLKSLAQFYLDRTKSNNAGHVIFLERLVHPKLDKNISKISVDNEKLGAFNVFTYMDNDKNNLGQIIMMYLLNVLVRNHFPEAIGYPDPLHKADQGAKTMGKSVAKIVKSSTIYLNSNPLNKSFRDTRDKQRR